MFVFFFFFNDTATTEIYTLSLHDALPISLDPTVASAHGGVGNALLSLRRSAEAAAAYREAIARAHDAAWCHVGLDRKSTRLNSSHTVISYAVFCLKKKKRRKQQPSPSREI